MADWLLRQPSSGLSPTQKSDMAQRLNISEFLFDVLERRGISGEREINDFLNASLRDLVNPERWPQVPEAADFIVKALLEGKKLAVWGDYDVDGTTSTAVVLDVLEFHGFKPLWHIPDRHKEGYGLNIPAVEALAAQGCKFLLTVDTGIADVGPIARAKELGMDVVISDHHMPPETLPPADRFFNPRMFPKDKVPCPHLAGVGVAFFLMAAVNTRLAKITGKAFKLDQVLDLVALGTLADVMRVTGQNRILVRGGLRHLARPSMRPGIAALKSVSNIPAYANVNATQISFKVAPRINAAGRMRHAKLALDLLRSRSYEDGMNLAEELDQLNSTRRTTEKIILEDAREQAKRSMQENTGLVLYGKQWHPGVIGIVATRIAEEFHVPCIIVCDDKDSLKGSGRSVPGFNIYEGLSQISDSLLAFGGHKQAAGVRILPGKLEEFRRAFQGVTAKMLKAPSKEELLLDGVIGFAQAGSLVHLQELAMMEPFGAGNPEPVFASNPVEIVSRAAFRARPESVDLKLRDCVDGRILHAKGWRMASDFPSGCEGQVIRIVFTLRTESRFGLISPELTIMDWGPADKPIGTASPDSCKKQEESEDVEFAGNDDAL